MIDLDDGSSRFVEHFAARTICNDGMGWGHAFSMKINMDLVNLL